MGFAKGLIVFNRQNGDYYYINDNVSTGNIPNKSVFDIAKDREAAGRRTRIVKQTIILTEDYANESS